MDTEDGEWASTSKHSHARDNELANDDEDSRVLIAKGVTMLVLCSVSICMGILPMCLARWLKWGDPNRIGKARSTRLVGMLLGFGGGVLFCTTFLHLLPEVSEAIADLTAHGKLPAWNFALAEALACLGFFLMFLVEEALHARLRRRESARQRRSRREGAPDAKDGKKDAMDAKRSGNELLENGQTALSSVSSLPSDPIAPPRRAATGHGHSHVAAAAAAAATMAAEVDDSVASSLRGLLIVLGLSVHELFEGLAVGLESSSADVWYMFAAVSAHKFVIAFCIGVELVASRTRPYLAAIYVCSFALVSPLGIGVGMLLVGGGSAAASGPLAVILQGLATGTLLYVVFFEILQEHRSGFYQFTSILVGFLLMFGLQVLSE